MRTAEKSSEKKIDKCSLCLSAVQRFWVDIFAFSFFVVWPYLGVCVNIRCCCVRTSKPPLRIVYLWLFYLHFYPHKCSTKKIEKTVYWSLKVLCPRFALYSYRSLLSSLSLARLLKRSLSRASSKEFKKRRSCFLSFSSKSSNPPHSISQSTYVWTFLWDQSMNLF